MIFLKEMVGCHSTRLRRLQMRERKNPLWDLNNHIYFRFAGGATDLAKRSRRLELIANILKEYGFNIKIKGDLLIARLAGLNQVEMEQVLDQTGRLIAYARQLDAVLQDDADIAVYAKKFFDGVYDI